MILSPKEHREYLKWKRQNVAFRGMREVGEENGGMALMGQGLYTAALSNKSLSRTYGDVYFAVNSKPKNPKKFKSVNQWEIWFQGHFLKEYNYDSRKFTEAGKNIRDEMMKLGYDGVEIVGRETVNYTPNNVKYFKTEKQVLDYYINFVMGANSTE